MASISRTLVRLGVLACLIAGVLAPQAAFGSTFQIPGPEPVDAAFPSSCPLAHRASDDPIVFPGRPGRSHLHDFLGNRSTNAFSTAASLLSGETTCERSGDKSGYWVPSLLVNDQPWNLQAATAYYAAGVTDRQSIRIFPAGLRMIAGYAMPMPQLDSMATAHHKARHRKHRRHVKHKRRRHHMRHAMAAQHSMGDQSAMAGAPVDPKIASYSCEFPTCLTLGPEILITFPDCWDGVHLDSADHRSHMAYNVEGACPASHPVPVPQIRLQLVYDAIPANARIALSSGSIDTRHADFFNAWDPPTLQTLVDTCLRSGASCVGE
jgi:hypothetical protein